MPNPSELQRDEAAAKDWDELLGADNDVKDGVMHSFPESAIGSTSPDDDVKPDAIAGQ
jgi:hypothetical protein